VQNCSRSVACRPRSREPYSLVCVFYAIQGEERWRYCRGGGCEKSRPLRFRFWLYGFELNFGVGIFTIGCLYVFLAVFVKWLATAASWTHV